MSREPGSTPFALTCAPNRKTCAGAAPGEGHRAPGGPPVVVAARVDRGTGERVIGAVELLAGTRDRPAGRRVTHAVDRTVRVQGEGQPHRRLMHGAVRAGVRAADGAG